jgi:hypothetical protein
MADTNKDPGILKKLGDKAHEVVSALKSLPPNEGEAESMRYKKQQTDALAPHQQPTQEDKPATFGIAPIDRVNPINDPLSYYGRRPGSGQVLYKVDREGNLTPIQVAPPLTPTPAHKMQASPAPTKSALKPIVPESLKEPMPLYDDGGEVDVNDGKHQAAILEDGERVLTPEENERYKKEHPAETSEGVPADFSGRVIPNPKGLKPIMDTGDTRPSDTDRLPKGSKLSIDNAPAKAHEGDISNPPAADVQPNALREISTSEKKPELRPYSQVMEDKAKAAARDKVNNPGVQTETSNVGGNIEEQPAEEKPKPTLGQKMAENWLKKIGSLDIDKMQKPEALNTQPSAEGGAPQGPQSPLKPIVNPSDNTGSAKPALAGKDAYHAKIAEYDKTFQSLMDRAAATNDPALREQAARVKEAKLEYQQAHPWGAPESAHPGMLGKIGHVAEQVASRTPILAPIMATFPQSELGSAAQREGAREQVKESATENTAREAAEAKADKATADKYTLKEIVDKRPDSPTFGKLIYAGVNNTDPTDVRYTPLETAPKQTAGADKSSFQAVLKKIGTPDVADPTQQKQAIETAHKTKGPDGQPLISDEEYKGALAYLGSTSNAPATQAAQAEQKRTAGKTLYFNTPTGRKALTAAEAKNQGFDPSEGVTENETQVAKDREKASTYRVIKRSLEQYQGDVAKGQLTPQDITTMTTITEDAEKPDYISKLIAGGFDDLLGHPVTGYSEKLMKGTLTKNQYQDLTPAGRKLVADYYTTMMAHFANMKAAQGTIPRNPYIIQTEMHTIPKPFLSEEEAKPAFQNYLDQVDMRNSDNVDFGGAKGVAKAPTVAAPTGATDEVVKDGKVIGHVVVQDGKKVYQPLQ